MLGWIVGWIVLTVTVTTPPDRLPGLDRGRAAAAAVGIPGMVDFDLINSSKHTLWHVWITRHAFGSRVWEEVLGGWGLLPGGQIRVQRANPKWIGIGVGAWDVRIEYKIQGTGTRAIRKWEIFEQIELGKIGVLHITEKEGKWEYLWKIAD